MAYQWEEPPPIDNQRISKGDPDWLPIIKQRPEEWLLIESTTRTKANGRSTRIRKTYPGQIEWQRERKATKSAFMSDGLTRQWLSEGPANAAPPKAIP